MGNVIQANNVQEAVELAQTYKVEGRYDWFRGQTQGWPPLSSARRLRDRKDSEALEKARNRLILFHAWLQTDHTLGYLAEDENIDQFYAIAQHYGIPTNYIDFTTEPAIAAFFAADTSNPPPVGVQSCIYCLNTKELRDVMSIVLSVRSQEGLELKAIEVDVTNLWRLQAQHGVFLFANYNWEIDFDLDRIVFPYTGYPSYPPRGLVYPADKSALEHRLDEYFDYETKHFGRDEMRKLFEEINAAGGNAEFLEMTSPADGVNAAAFVDPSRVMPLASWSREVIATWHSYPSEHFHSVGEHIERLYLSAGDRTSLQRAIGYGIKQALDANPQKRGRLIEWVLEGEVGNLPVERVAALFRSAWNGMRSLPYSNAQIATTMASIADLVLVNHEAGREVIFASEHFANVISAPVWVEFANSDGSSSRGYASTEPLRQAMRPDLKELVIEEYREIAEDPETTLQMILDPARLFEFEALVEIFARDIIPSQLLLGRKPTLFNPALLKTFGLP